MTTTTTKSGLTWGVPKTEYGGYAAFFTDENNPITPVRIAPDQTIMIAGGMSTGAGFIHMAPEVYFTAPPRPVWDTDATRDRDLKTNQCASNGMAVASAHLMLCSLSISDTPLAYAPPYGPGIDFRLTYNHREGSDPGFLNTSNFGSRWLHNWLSYVEEETEEIEPAFLGEPWRDPPVPARPGTASLTPILRLPGGGSERFDSAVYSFVGGPPLPHTFSNRADARRKLVKVAAQSYELRNPDGSKLVFGYAASAGRYYLTQIIDRAGHAVTVAYDATHRITTVTDAAGRASTFSYELASEPRKITRITDPFGRSCRFEYNADGYLFRITDVIGLTSEFSYQGDFINSMTTPYGTSTFAQGADPTGRWLTLTDPQGAVERVQFYHDIQTLPDQGPLPTGVTNPGQSERFRYTLYWDKKAMLEKPNDPSSARLYHWLGGQHYDSSGLLFSEKAPLENRVVFNYEGQVGAREGSSGRVSKVARVLDDGSTQLSSMRYDTFGNLEASIDALGRETSYVYAANGIDLLEVRQKTGATTYDVLAKFTYGAWHLPATATDAAGQVTTFTYNPAGQVRTVTNAKSETTTFWYHPTGEVADPPLDPNATGYVVRVDGAVAGASTRVLYDSSGRPRTVTDSDGHAVTTDYDAFDRPRRITYPDSTYQELTYNRLDPETSRDRRGRISKFKYNAVRQLEQTTDALGRVTRYDWCKCGALEALIDPLGQPTLWSYDVQSRVVGKRYADGSALTYKYENTTSRLRSTTDGLGQVTSYRYFADNALRDVIYTNARVPTPTVSFTYDTHYARVKTMVDGIGTTTYDYHPILGTPSLGAGRLASVDGPLANDTITYGYDELGRVANRAIDGDSNRSLFSFDALGRVRTVTNPLGAFTLEYVNTTGRLDHVLYPNGQRTNYAYHPVLAPAGTGNGDLRLRKIENLRPGGANLSTFEYTYDAEGLIETWSRRLDAGPGLPSVFKYDRADQLTDATVANTTGPAKSYIYRYDRGGNRTSEQIDGVSTSENSNRLNQLTSITSNGLVRFEGTTSEPARVTANNRPATADAGNTFRVDVPLTSGPNTVNVTATDGSGNAQTRRYQVQGAAASTRTLAYDLNGNMTNDGAGKTYEWDAANRLVRIIQTSGITEFGYDGLSRRVLEKLNGTIIKRWVWCNGPQPCEERDAAGAVTKRFFAGLGQQNATENFVYSTDHLGSIREMTDSSGALRARYQYDPYGRQTKVSGDMESDFGFTGHYTHQRSGLVLTLYRAYDPDTGRWTTRDPIAEAGGLNLYAYVEGNPINRVDPLGLDWLEDASNFAAGFGDTISFGLTKKARQWMGYDDVVDKCSGAYSGGEWTGIGASMLMGGGGILKGGAQGLKTLLKDPRRWSSISRAFWRQFPNGAEGRALSHWLIPRSATWVPNSIKNAGWNTVLLSGRFNTWMGFAPMRFGVSAWEKAAAIAADHAVRFSIGGTLAAPATAALNGNDCTCK